MIIKINEKEATNIIEKHLSEHFYIIGKKNEKTEGDSMFKPLLTVWTECDEDDNITFNCEVACP